MPFITVRVTAAHIANVAAPGYGPRIILAALNERLVDHVHVFVRECWLILAYQGGRHYVHLPLHVIPYTFRMRRTPLLSPIAFRIELPAELVRDRRRAPRKPNP